MGGLTKEKESLPDLFSPYIFRATKSRALTVKVLQLQI